MEAKTLLGQTLMNIADGTCKEYVIFASTKEGIDMMAEISGEHRLSYFRAVGKLYRELADGIADDDKAEVLQ